MYIKNGLESEVGFNVRNIFLTALIGQTAAHNSIK